MPIVGPHDPLRSATGFPSKCFMGDSRADSNVSAVKAIAQPSVALVGSHVVGWALHYTYFLGASLDAAVGGPGGGSLTIFKLTTPQRFEWVGRTPYPRLVTEPGMCPELIGRRAILIHRPPEVEERCYYHLCRKRI
jgi:hypothetical protein